MDYDSDETFIYHDDGTSHKSAMETDSESPCFADVELSASTDTETDCSLPPEDSEIVHDVSVTFTEIETVTKSLKINREMDIISISQETALKRLLEVDVSDLIDDEDMKSEIKFFHESKSRKRVQLHLMQMTMMIMSVMMLKLSN